MIRKVKLFFFKRYFDRDSVNNVLLTSILDSDETESEGHILSFDHSFCISTLVHDINFGDDTDCPDTFGVYVTSDLEAV